jgi:hypothetical protein
MRGSLQNASEGQAMTSLVWIERGPTSQGASVPDLPGCVAVAETLGDVRHGHAKGGLTDADLARGWSSGSTPGAWRWPEKSP